MRWITLLGGAYLALLLANIPAVWVIQQPNLTALEGSLWQGRAQLMYQGRTYADLSWRLKPLALFKGQLAFDVTASTLAGTVQGIAAFKLGTVELQLAAAVLDIEHASLELPVAVSGEVHLAPVSLTLDYQGEVNKAQGTLVWQAATVGSPPQAIGTLQVNLAAQQGALVAFIEDQQGPIAVTGNARWHPKQGISLQASLAAREHTFAPWVTFIGPADASGWHHWHW